MSYRREWRERGRTECLMASIIPSRSVRRRAHLERGRLVRNPTWRIQFNVGKNSEEKKENTVMSHQSEKKAIMAEVKVKSPAKSPGRKPRWIIMMRVATWEQVYTSE